MILTNMERPTQIGRWAAMTAVVAVFAATPATSAPVVDAFSGLTSVPSGGPLAEKLRAGHDALAQRAYAKADALFNQAASIDRSSPLPWLALAESARVRGDGSGVQRWLTKAREVAPTDAGAMTAMARWHFAHREFSKAESLWRGAVAADPKAAAALVDLGDLHFNVYDRPEAAGEFYRRALAIDPELAGAHYALGAALMRGKQPDAALKEFNEAARLSANNPLPLHAIGELHAAQGRTDEALMAFDLTLKVQAGYFPARLAKGDVLLASGRPEQALAEYREVARAQPKVALAHLKAGMALQQLSRPNDAFAAYQAAIQADAKQSLALNNLAWLAADRSDVPDRGLAWAERAVALNAGEPRFHGTLAWVHFKRGDAAKAIALLENLVAGSARTLADTHYLLGVVQAERGDPKKAAIALNEALRLNPKFGMAADAKARLRKLGVSS